MSQYFRYNTFDFHHGKSLTNTVAGTSTEWDVGEMIIGFEWSIRIEGVWVGKQIWITAHGENWYCYICTSGKNPAFGYVNGKIECKLVSNGKSSIMAPRLT